MAGDFDITTGDMRMRVDGLSKTMRALTAAGADTQDMKDLMHAIGMIVVTAARPKVPTRTGNLAASMRAGRGKTKAVARAGGAKVPYAGVIHYGWPKRGIAAQPFLQDALQAKRTEVFDTLDEGLANLLKAHNLI